MTVSIEFKKDAGEAGGPGETALEKWDKMRGGSEKEGEGDGKEKGGEKVGHGDALVPDEVDADAEDEDGAGEGEGGGGLGGHDGL